MSRLTIPGGRGARAIREAQSANFPHRWTIYVKVREVDPDTGEVTITYEEGAIVNCRINPAAVGGLNVAAGQEVVAGEWLVSMPWNVAGIREGDRGLVQQGPDSEKTFATLVEVKRILRPTSAETVTAVYCDSVVLL
jgi:hypothetical protein